MHLVLRQKDKKGREKDKEKDKDKDDEKGLTRKMTLRCTAEQSLGSGISMRSTSTSSLTGNTSQDRLHRLTGLCTCA